MTTTALSPEFIKEIKDLRRRHQLHDTLVATLRAAVASLFPDWVFVPEIAQTPGGRNDGVLFEASGKSICFELFATKSQVDRDLMLLYESSAEKKIAILIDREIDPGVSEAYYRKRPKEPFPVIWLSQVMLEDKRLLLHTDIMGLVLGDRAADVFHIARQILKTAPERIIRQWKAKGIEIFSSPPDKPNYKSTLTLIVVSKIRRLGVQWEHCEGAALLVNESWDFILSMIGIGNPLFLVRFSGDSQWSLLDLGDYQGVLSGGLLSRDGDHIAVLVNSAYDELRKLYRNPLPDPGDMNVFLDLHFRRQAS